MPCIAIHQHGRGAALRLLEDFVPLKAGDVVYHNAANGLVGQVPTGIPHPRPNADAVRKDHGGGVDGRIPCRRHKGANVRCAHSNELRTRSKLSTSVAKTVFVI